MYEFFIFMLGFASCMVLLYVIGKSMHAGHGDGKTATGPSSRTNTKENVVSIVKKG